MIGLVFGVFVTAYGWLRRRNEALQIGMTTFAFSGLAAVAVYLTGESAEEIVEDLAGVSHAAIERHEEAALIALVAILALGALSLVGLWMSRKDVPRWFSTATLILALAVTGVMGWTANLGGPINHPEIRSESTAGLTNEDGELRAAGRENDDDDHYDDD